VRILIIATVLAAAVSTAAPRAEDALAPVDASKLTSDPLGQAAVGLLDQVFNRKQVKEGFDAYVGEPYIQHNPQVPTGRDAAITALSGLLKQVPGWRYDFKRVLVDGDLVAIHSHVTTGPEDRGSAVVDIFRAENGKFVEHWDVIQPVPEKAANDNTMF
jgi:predicted SnoaL-like aldol condensation-catalyzing enzyme